MVRTHNDGMIPEQGETKVEREGAKLQNPE
jgi:hypothetical protein